MPFERQRVLLGKWLYFFACWTILIKYVLPISAALRDGVSLTQYIYFWDLWWAAHLYVGWGLCKPKAGIWKWAFLLTATEIIIIVSKFVIYLKDPNLDFWHVNWFVNKVFLLVYFSIMAVWLFGKKARQEL